MRPIRFLITAILINTCFISRAQEIKPAPGDSSVAFTVHGACVQCKERIETAAKIKGVKYANWDVDTKQLRLVYNPAVAQIETIRRRIVNAGHDLDDRKAKLTVYNNLPACCHYRELETANVTHTIVHDTVVVKQEIPVISKTDSIAATIPTQQNFVKGVVLEVSKKGDFSPLTGATVLWLRSRKGISTDASGTFSLPIEDSTDQLIISYTGFRPDTVSISDERELKIILAQGNQLHEVKVTARQRSTYIAAMNPIRTQVMTEKELFKAACCNLSESFETNPSVDVSYNDAVTGSKQIQLLGLSGNYTQLTVENLPGPRGIATPLGLNSIAGPWVESIQLTKGIGSVANGYESIAGQINVELKKPENSERLFANLYVNDFGKSDLNLNLSQKLGKKWSAGLLLHDDFLFNKKLDDNKDGFRDLPTGNQFSMVNRWKYDDGKGLLAQFGVKLLLDNRTGGELAFNPDNDKLTNHRYGLGTNTERYEGFAKIGYVFPAKKYKSFGFQLSAISHKQDSYFGLTSYDAREQNFYLNAIYQSIINTTAHKFRTGFSLLYDHYDETLKAQPYRRTETVPGAFFEYTFTPNEKFNVVAGLRGDYNSLFGAFGTARLHLRYEPVKGTTIRISAGNGQRTANIFAENMGALVSSRQLMIINPAAGKAYGLNPEKAWNKGISIDQQFKLFKHNASVSLDFFRNDFTSQVVVDMEQPGQLKFYNLTGRSYSNSFQAELNLEPVDKLELRFAYRYFDVKTDYNGQLKERPLLAPHRAFANIAYAVKGWKFDYTVTYNGPKRVPGTASNPPAYQRSNYSPGFWVMNTQVSKTIGKKHPFDLYVGAENLGAYMQPKAIIAADQPFSPYFDASMVWGPVTGRMLYAGLRYKIK